MPLTRHDIAELKVHHLEYGVTRNLIGDYASAPIEAAYTNVSGTHMLVTHIVVHVEDVGKMDSGLYGNNIVLTNGITNFGVDDQYGRHLVDLVNGDAIISNSDWAHYAERVDLISWGTGNDTMIVHVETIPQWGTALYIPNGGRLHVDLNDDFTGLVRHEFTIWGVHVR